MQIEEIRITIDFWWVQSQMYVNIQVSICFEPLKLNGWPSGITNGYNNSIIWKRNDVVGILSSSQSSRKYFDENEKRAQHIIIDEWLAKPVQC